MGFPIQAEESKVSKTIYMIIALSLSLWAAGFFFLSAGPLVHCLLLTAVVAAIIKVLKG